MDNPGWAEDLQSFLDSVNPAILDPDPYAFLDQTPTPQPTTNNITPPFLRSPAECSKALRAQISEPGPSQHPDSAPIHIGPQLQKSPTVTSRAIKPPGRRGSRKRLTELPVKTPSRAPPKKLRPPTTTPKHRTPPSNPNRPDTLGPLKMPTLIPIQINRPLQFPKTPSTSSTIVTVDLSTPPSSPTNRKENPGTSTTANPRPPPTNPERPVTLQARRPHHAANLAERYLTRRTRRRQGLPDDDVTLTRELRALRPATVPSPKPYRKTLYTPDGTRVRINLP